MDLPNVINTAIAPAMDILALPLTPKAMVMMLAIGLQESRFLYRAQVVDNKNTKGPARGFWQFEKGGGVKGVLTHPSSVSKAGELCKARGVVAVPGDVWLALESDDVLAAGFARLLLLTDPRPLPELNDVEGAWLYYTRNWRPGKPHRHTWNAMHAQAVAAA